jgi:hypothetical protein
MLRIGILLSVGRYPEIYTSNIRISNNTFIIMFFMGFVMGLGFAFFYSIFYDDLKGLLILKIKSYLM